MAVLDDLERKLETAEARVADVTGKLESLGSVQGALDDSNDGLKSAAEKVGRVADLVESTMRSLFEVLSSFRDVVEVLRKSDPASLLEAQTRVESSVGESQRHIAEIEGALSGVSRQVADVQEEARKLESAVGEMRGEAEPIVEKVVVAAEARVQEEIRRLESVVSEMRGEAEPIVEKAILAAEDRLREEIKEVARSVQVGRTMSVILIVGVVTAVVLLLVK